LVKFCTKENAGDKQPSSTYMNFNHQWVSPHNICMIGEWSNEKCGINML